MPATTSSLSLRLLLMTLLTILPFTSSKPFDKPGTNGIPDTPTDWFIWNFNEKVWKKQIVRHDSPDDAYRPTKKPNKKNHLNWCDWRARWRVEKTLPMQPGKAELKDTCREIPDVAGLKGESPCHNLGMDNSAMMGMWGSIDIQCELYFDDWCKKSAPAPNTRVDVNKANRPLDWIYFDYANLTVPPNEWGHDNMDAARAIWRVPGRGFGRRGYEGFGPKSLRCWLLTKPVAVGLGGGSEVGITNPNKRDTEEEEERPMVRKRHTGEELPPETDEEFSERVQKMLRESEERHDGVDV